MFNGPAIFRIPLNNIHIYFRYSEPRCSEHVQTSSNLGPIRDHQASWDRLQGQTTYRNSSEHGALQDVFFQTAIIVLTKKEPNRHYHVMTSVNPRHPNVKKA